MSRKIARRHVNAATRHALRNTLTAQELLASSATVILRRSAMGAAAMERPTAEAVLEGSTMVTEKLAAMAESGATAVRSGADAALAAVGYAVQEAAALGRAAGQVAVCATPNAVLGLQNRMLTGFFNRLLTHNLAMGSLMLQAGSAALTPFHAAARANARRLTR